MISPKRSRGETHCISFHAAFATFAWFYSATFHWRLFANHKVALMYGLHFRVLLVRQFIVTWSDLTPRSTSFHVIGTAIGNPGRALGEYVPTAVCPRPLRR